MVRYGLQPNTPYINYTDSYSLNPNYHDLYSSKCRPLHNSADFSICFGGNECENFLANRSVRASTSNRSDPDSRLVDVVKVLIGHRMSSANPRYSMPTGLTANRQGSTSSPLATAVRNSCA